jgi:anti-sigma-K factor RskA
MTSDLDCGGDAAAYVLGAMDPAEAEEFQRHLVSCPHCREEVDALDGAAAALPLMVNQVQPPGTLRTRVMAEVRADARAKRPKPSPTIRQRLAKPVPKPALAGFGALAIAAVATVALTFKPASSHIVRAQIAWAQAAAVVKVTGSQGELLIEGMPQPPAGKIYEVWLKHGSGDPRATNALFDPNSAGEAGVEVPGDVSGDTTVMVTAEPDGGSRTPTSSPVIIANLT